MKTISREELISSGWAYLTTFGYNQIWAYYNQRKMWNPKTEEVVMEYNAVDSGRYQTKRETPTNVLRMGKRKEGE